ncbi:MAG TPA: glycosyltransferase family 2 protein [Candidatus Scatomonas merdavium]|nr:glycosyltransferase family 2 protein [Candidatus Scatomonas merdavium]
MLVSIVIPCYNSEHTIGEVVDLCMEEFDKMDGYECEMILVNDFSRDGTFEAIRRAAEKYPNVTGISLAKNFGQHAAIMAGLHYVRGELVVGMDDDMQNHPSQIRQFLEKEKEGYDVVFGVFQERKFGFMKNLTGAVSRFLLWHLLERPKGIQMSSFWLARRYVIEKVKEYEGNNAFIQLLFFRTTHNMANIEIEHYEREVGQSNYTFRKGLKLFMSFMNYSTIPLRLSTVFGVLFSMAGFIAALVVLIHKLVDPSVAVGWSSLMCAMLILFGIVFLMLGILGEYVGKLILTSSKTPQYVIRDIVNEERKTEEKTVSKDTEGKDDD